MLFWLISLYPIKQTCETLKKVKLSPKEEGYQITNWSVHWCTYWLIYALFMHYDFILSYIPFWSIISPLVLVMAYNPVYTTLIYENGVKAFQYKIQLLNTVGMQRHLDFVASQYLVPGLEFMEHNIASQLPSPFKEILVNLGQTVHAVFISASSTASSSSSSSSTSSHRNSRKSDGPYKMNDPTMKSE